MSQIQRWRPIATAPQDGTDVLTYRAGIVRQAHWGRGDGGEECWRGPEWPCPAYAPPTHWMPLPPAPPREES